jgi:phosphoadenosine phosphosulfate reductase
LTARSRTTDAARVDAHARRAAKALGDKAHGEIAVVSSFGSESAVLLHLVAEANPATPVIFIDTRMLFAETLAYKDNWSAISA